MHRLEAGSDRGAQTGAEGLARLRQAVLADLEAVEYPPRAWVPPRLGPDGRPVLDAVVVGAGLSGLSIAFGLLRRRVSNILVIDRAPQGHEGPWATYARMDTLRSPKTLSGLDYGVPSLTYRAWHVAAYGAASWRALDKIDRRDWMAYLAWYRAVLDLPVANETALVGIGEGSGHLVLDVLRQDRPERLYARKLVLATGIDGSGRPVVPPMVAALPAALWHHSAAVPDDLPFAGRRIAVIGAGASGFDAAVHALRGGAAAVVLHARRAVLPNVEVLAWSNFPGFLMSFADLPDEERWRFMRRMRGLVAPPTQEMFDEAAADPRFSLRLGGTVTVAAEAGGVAVASDGDGAPFDHLIAATGFATDLSQRPELAALHPHMALWRDRFRPAAGEEDDELAAYPYLGRAFELQSVSPAHAAALGRVHLFNTGAVPSLGPVCNGVTGLKYGAPRIADAIARDLFTEDRAMHYDRLMSYDDSMFDGSPERLAALRAGLTPVGRRNGAARAEADRLIAETRGRSAEFPVLLANHLPMVLEALCRLGASPERLAAYAEHYDSLHAVPPLPAPVAPITAGSWTAALGDRSREADYRAFFLQETRRLGGPGAIRIYVPRLSHGVGASALHGLMRLAYGVLRADDAEIGAGLGYWAATFLPLPDRPEGPPVTDEPLALAAAMQDMPAFIGAHVDSHLLWGWIEAIGNKPEFAPLIGRLRLGPDGLDRVAAASLALYAGTMSFEALHAVTGSHWVRLVAPHLDDPRQLTRHFWQVILAVYPKIGMPAPASAEAMAALRAVPPPPDAEIAGAAVASDDEHDHSLVFSALQEYARTGDPLYRVLAARRVGLLP